MSKRERDHTREESLVEAKAKIRDQYARMPWMDWFRKEPKPKESERGAVEKNDRLAMILAALSLVMPPVLGFGVVFALLMLLIQWLS